MKTFLKACLPLLAVAALGACNKDKYETTVSGYVVEKNGTRKLAGAKVYLVEDHSGTYAVTQTYHDSTVSGPDGHYSFTFDLGEGEFRVIAVAENHYDVTTPLHSRQQYLLTLGETQTYNVELWPYAWLKMRFINESGAEGINVNPLYGQNDGPSIWGEQDVTVIGLTRGNETTILNYFVYPGGEHQEEHVYCPGLDTTYHEIRY